MLQEIGDRHLQGVGDRRRVQAHGQGGNGQHRQDGELAAVQVDQLGDMLVGDRAEDDALDHHSE